MLYIHIVKAICMPIYFYIQYKEREEDFIILLYLVDPCNIRGGQIEADIHFFMSVLFPFCVRDCTVTLQLQ